MNLSQTALRSLILSTIALLAACGPPSEKAMARRTIDLCWDDQKRKSLDPGAARFVASTCEMLEKNFMEKYGHKP